MLGNEVRDYVLFMGLDTLGVLLGGKLVVWIFWLGGIVRFE